MNQYSYDATNQDGESVSGEVLAESVGEAVQQIELLGLQLNSIQLTASNVENQIAIDPSELLSSSKPTQANAPQRDLPEWKQSLETSIARKACWLPALRAMLAELPASRARTETAKLLSFLERDFSAQELLNSPELIRVLPLLTTTVSQNRPSATDGPDVKSDVLDAGQLHQWLEAILIQQEAQMQRWRAFAYPIFLLSLASALFVAMAFFLIPIFREMYADFGLSLPSPTLLVFWIAEQITDYAMRTLVVLLIVGVVGAIVIYYWRRMALTNRLLGRLVAGTGSNLRAMSQLIQTLAELLSLGAPLADALAIAGRTCRHAVFESAAKDVASQLDHAEVHISALPAMETLPPTLAVALSGETPNVPLLRELAVMYSERTRRHSSWVASMLPSASVLVVGVTIGFVVITLFMPLVTLVSALA